MEYAIVKPKKGRRVKDPRDMAVLPENGRRVKMDRYWRRRLKDGDVELAATLSSKPTPKKEGDK